MTRTYHFAESLGTTECKLRDGSFVSLPVFPGILKHPRPSELFALMKDEDVARNYTRVALQKAGWQILKTFQRDWLAACLEQSPMRAGRRGAIRFLLGLDPSPFDPVVQLSTGDAQ